MEITEKSIKILSPELQARIKKIVKNIPEMPDFGIATSNPAVLYKDNSGNYFYKRNIQHQDMQCFYPLIENTRVYFVKLRPYSMQINIINRDHPRGILQDYLCEIKLNMPDDDEFYLAYCKDENGFYGTIVNDSRYNRTVVCNASTEPNENYSCLVGCCSCPDYEITFQKRIYVHKGGIF